MILIKVKQFDELLLKIEKIEKHLVDTRGDSQYKSEWITNEVACKLLCVTSRTMQNYRDKGVLPFSKIGSKIYYKMSDIKKHLEENYLSEFKGERRVS